MDRIDVSQESLRAHKCTLHQGPEKNRSLATSELYVFAVLFFALRINEKIFDSWKNCFFV